MANNAKDITGQRFGRLVAIGVHGSHDRKVTWDCLCDCGNRSIVTGTNLRGGGVQSCGCLRIDKIKAANTKHGHAIGYKPTTEYRVYMGMIQRCTNPNHTEYHSYGGRGIDISDRWMESFENFIADMGPKPAGYQLDRTNNEGGYSADNCKWVTRSDNGNNKRNSVNIEMSGMTMTISQWSRKQHIPLDTLWKRLRAGWSTEKALTEPIHLNGMHMKAAAAKNSQEAA